MMFEYELPNPVGNREAPLEDAVLNAIAKAVFIRVNSTGDRSSKSIQSRFIVSVFLTHGLRASNVLKAKAEGNIFNNASKNPKSMRHTVSIFVRSRRDPQQWPGGEVRVNR